MKVVIVAATSLEIQPLINYLASHQNSGNQKYVEVLVTGIGSLISTYYLTRFLSVQQPDYCIQAGLAGTFTSELTPGKVVLIRDEALGDLGAEESGGFHDIFDIGLSDASGYPFQNKKLINPHMNDWSWLDLPVVNGVTVNEISTLRSRIDFLAEKYDCQVETMEGAAFHYVCLQHMVPFVQLRAVSNFIGDRNRKNWNFEDSIANLNDTLIKIVKSNNW
jgi:futalosine hydrolase